MCTSKGNGLLSSYKHVMQAFAGDTGMLVQRMYYIRTRNNPLPHNGTLTLMSGSTTARNLSCGARFFITYYHGLLFKIDVAFNIN